MKQVHCPFKVALSQWLNLGPIHMLIKEIVELNLMEYYFIDDEFLSSGTKMAGI